MKLLRAILNETLGMFIDDGSLALLSALLIIAVGAIAWLTPAPDLLICLALLVGCIAILAMSVIRAARR